MSQIKRRTAIFLSAVSTFWGKTNKKSKKKKVIKHDWKRNNSNKMKTLFITVS